MVRGNEIPAWISDYGNVELLETVHDICPKAILVNQAVLVVRVINASIDASSYVSTIINNHLTGAHCDLMVNIVQCYLLQESSIYQWVDVGDYPGTGDVNRGRLLIFHFLESCHCGGGFLHGEIAKQEMRSSRLA